MQIDPDLKPRDLEPLIERFFDLAAGKTAALEKVWDPAAGSPVFTRRGRYTTQGWTEWTQGFQYGAQAMVFDATGDERFLHMARSNTWNHMAPHVSHTGVHDHGFNNVSTYGALRRLALEGRTGETEDALGFYALALRVSGAVQAARWTPTHDGPGFIHSFNGPHSLFSDTLRSCRVLVIAHLLGHRLMGEGDRPISLLGRALEHIQATARWNVYYGKGRDAWDVRGRVVHESIFNTADGRYRCPSSQQGYSPFTTWTRGLAWVLLGAAEELECFRQMPESDFEPFGGRANAEETLLEMARATADFYIDNTTADGIPFWDAGAPGLDRLGDWRARPSEPDNEHEPVDSSAAAIAAQGLLRLGRLLGARSRAGQRYRQAGLAVTRALLQPPYLSESPRHHGLVLHSIYHRPNGWDYVPPGGGVPRGESSMWGDYHALELALYLQRIIQRGPYLTFHGCVES